MSSPCFLIFLFTFIFGVHILSIFRDWYFLFPWLDTPLHFLGGLFIGLSAIYLTNYLSRLFGDRNRLEDFIFVLGAVSLIGILWEFFEFGLDYFYSLGLIGFQSQLSVADTIGDLFFDILGGLAAVFSNWFFPSSSSRRADRLRL